MKPIFAAPGAPEETEDFEPLPPQPARPMAIEEISAAIPMDLMSFLVFMMCLLKVRRSLYVRLMYCFRFVFLCAVVKEIECPKPGTR